MAVLQSKTPCIETTYAKSPAGYGQCNRKGLDGNIYNLHHRLVYAEHYGPIPKGMHIRHLCHNPACINIEHLAIGTPKDNRQDERDVGKGFEGIKNPSVKLTEDQAREILSLKPLGKRPRALMKQLAQEYNVTWYTIQDIWIRKSWKHLP